MEEKITNAKSHLDKAVTVVSLFDGISCGQLAFQAADIEVSSYHAFEIDKYAKSITCFNFPNTFHHGDVTEADFKIFSDIDFLIGGSPCQKWSISRKNRETDKDGIGWKMFSKFADAVKIIKPKWFLYENVASMPKTIKAYITEELGVEPILINSALLSAQQRKRLYWTNIENIKQPNDKGILLKDILERKKDINVVPVGAALRTREDKSGRFKRLEVRKDDKLNAFTTVLTDSVVCVPVRLGSIRKGRQGERIYSVHGKTVCLCTRGGSLGGATGLYKIDLPDGDYIVRKLTATEAERCQTLPDGYTAFGINDKGKMIKISNTQRYKCIGNG